MRAVTYSYYPIALAKMFCAIVSCLMKRGRNFEIIYSSAFLSLNGKTLKSIKHMNFKSTPISNLKRLICEIDAELFEAVFAEVLKPKNVQNGDACRPLWINKDKRNNK